MSFKIDVTKLSLILLAVIITSCNALKRVEEDELLLTKNTLQANGEKVTDETVQSLISQKPNSGGVLGYPLRLHLYNLAKKNPDTSYQKWLKEKPKREERLAALLSQKQVNRLGESFMVKGINTWLKNIGEAPVIVDTSKSRKSADRLKAYYGTKGYFNNEAHFSIDTTGKTQQRAIVNYTITLGKPFIIDSLTKNIVSPAIDSIYDLHANQSFVVQGKQFDLSDFTLERERLTTLFRNSGIFNFQESSITYDIARDTVVASDDQNLDVALQIENLKTRGGNGLASSEYKVNRFQSINIYADHTFGTNPNDLKSVSYNNYTIYYDTKKLRYKPKALTDAIFFTKDSIYRDLDRVRTYRQITNLNTFKYPNIEFIQDSTQTQLVSNIYLTARPKYSLGVDFDFTHSNIQRVGVGFSSALVSRNIFGGAETLSLAGRGSFGLLGDTSLSEDFFSEVGADINLVFPRIWLPIPVSKKIIPYYMLPQTKISLGTSFQKNIGLDKQTFNSLLGYSWTPSDAKRHAIELVNLQFVRNVNSNRFFNVFQNTFNRLDQIATNFQDVESLSEFYEETENPEAPLRLIIPEGTTGFTNAILEGEVPSSEDDFNEVRNIEERRQRLTENNLIFATNYTFTKNNKKGINDNNFYQYRLKLESAGNLLSGIAKIIPFNANNNGDELVFGVPYSQYVKTEFDYIKHWSVSHSNVLAVRSFIGIAVPYGNSNNIPFVRSYFAGGSNDNRAWFPYSLGPGRTKDVNDFNEANLKLAFNLEFRFPIAGSFKGALFADAGNIWNVYDNVDDPDATFNGFSSLADIALGSGFGIRYDFTYFVFRIDFGFKTYNPAEEPSKRWFRDYNFANMVPQIGINYPF
ncbi:BamA/TamA family outer membrane protein [Arenibacter sp. GZD96]|uniref:translocation and assembly module lipoprotein TamL n=1 Tax=Aurantibrevibacter litoralis TaxID=3106030 RepID=UPI002AFE780B|nr:BamA/TamA family outer membrane protein [Arenibacter sp. GZD-96]MEA1786957.1 BamA/TamA family outer membrane protein [Arenibacter sp. GZD-96]